MRMNLNKYIFVFLTATAMLLSGIILMWYVNGKIDGYQHMLSYDGLSVDDIGMITGSLDWWIVQKLMLFDPISYAVIAGGVITYGFGITTRYLTIKNEPLHQSVKTQKPNIFQKNIKSKKQEHSLDLVNLQTKITNYEKQLATSRHRINNLKENMDYLVNIINDQQEKNKPIVQRK